MLAVIEVLSQTLLIIAYTLGIEALEISIPVSSLKEGVKLAHTSLKDLN